MRIRFRREGGIGYFPGLSKPVEIDSESLPAQEADALKQMLNAVHFFDLPETINLPSHGAADQRQYTITIEDGERVHTVRLTDPIENPNLQALIAYIQTKRQAPG